MFDEEDAINEYDTNGYDYRSPYPDDEEVMPMNDFQHRRDKFDSDFDRIQKVIWITWAVTAIITLALLGGGVYVIYKVLTFFGIL